MKDTSDRVRWWVWLVISAASALEMIKIALIFAVSLGLVIGLVSAYRARNLPAKIVKGLAFLVPRQRRELYKQGWLADLLDLSSESTFTRWRFVFTTVASVKTLLVLWRAHLLPRRIAANVSGSVASRLEVLQRSHIQPLIDQGFAALENAGAALADRKKAVHALARRGPLFKDRTPNIQVGAAMTHIVPQKRSRRVLRPRNFVLATVAGLGIWLGLYEPAVAAAIGFALAATVALARLAGLSFGDVAPRRGSERPNNEDNRDGN